MSSNNNNFNFKIMTISDLKPQAVVNFFRPTTADDSYFLILSVDSETVWAMNLATSEMTTLSPSAKVAKDYMEFGGMGYTLTAEKIVTHDHVTNECPIFLKVLQQDIETGEWFPFVETAGAEEVVTRLMEKYESREDLQFVSRIN